MLNRTAKIILIITALLCAFFGGWLVNGPARIDAKGAETGVFYLTSVAVAGLFVLVNLVMLRRKGNMSQAVKTILANVVTAFITATIAIVVTYFLIQGAIPMNAQAWGVVVGALFGVAAITALSVIDRKPVEAA